MNSFFNWLLSSAGAGWAVAAFTLLGLVYTVVKRRRPNRIMVQEQDEVSLLMIAPRIRGLISVKFGDVPVERLSQLELEISNHGSDVVSDIDLRIAFPRDTKVLADSFLPVPGTLEVATSFQHAEANVTIPYLNPREEYEDRLQISYLCDGAPTPIYVTGGGEGWSVKHLRMPKKSAVLRRLALEYVLGFLAVVGALFFLSWRSGGLEQLEGPEMVGFLVIVTLVYVLLMRRAARALSITFSLKRILRSLGL